MDRRKFLGDGLATVSGLSIAGVPLHVLAAASGGSVLNTIVQPEPTGIMIATTQNNSATLVGGNISEGLLRFDEKLNPMPLLAISWIPNENKTQWVFKLKPNVRWHDGVPFTADDVLFTMNVMLRKTHERARSSMECIQEIKVLDPLTIQFNLKYAYAPFLIMFDTGAMPMAPKHIYEGTDFATNPANLKPIGTGPFKFKEWKRGSHIHLEANKDWHVTKPEVDALYFHIIPDAASRAAAFETGKVDVVPGGGVEFFDVARLAKLPGAEVSLKGWEVFAPQCWLWINNRNKPMDDINLRQAINYALDREAMAKVAFYGYAKPATSPFNSNLPYYSKKVKSYARNLVKAKELVAKSSYKGETLRLMPLPYGEAWQRLAEMMRQSLAQVGIKTEMVATDTAGYLQRLSSWDYDLSPTYIYQYGDPVGAERQWLTRFIAKGAAFNNVAGYSNPKIDELFDAGRRASDPAQRSAIYQKVQDILLEDVPVAWLLELNLPTLYRSKIRNVIVSGTGLMDGLGRASIAS